MEFSRESLRAQRLSRPLRRQKLGEEATRYLRDSLMAGDFKPGQRMGIEDLAHTLGISTMPVREALAMLANEGLLDVLPNRGFRVAPLGPDDVEDVFRVHAFAAGLLAERAANSSTKDLLHELRTLQLEIERLGRAMRVPAKRAAQIEELNYRFHRAINRSIDARRLRWFLRAATRFIPRHLYQAVPGWVAASVVDHPGLIVALEQRDGKVARRLMESHVLKAGSLVVEHLDASGFWRTVDPNERSQNAVAMG
jgi:DNA-binding GntR family transcriptional regulator